MTARSKNVFFYENPDGSGIKTACYINDNPVRWHLPYTKSLKDNQQLDVVVSKYTVDGVINTPIGGIENTSAKEKKEFTMSLKQYREFVAKFWEEGPDYYDII